MNIVLIVKASKLCNLRCTYCYETPELANKARISPENIERMFIQLRDFIPQPGEGGPPHKLTFIWHGGEPFAQPISYWQDIIHLENKVFGEEFKKKSITNEIQSNLTLITPKHLPLIRENFELGFSYDVINDLRITAGEQKTGNLVRKKIDWLISEGISLGGVAVISKINVDSPKTVADYFIEKGLSFRLLNIYQSLDDFSQLRVSAAPIDSFLKFLKDLYDLPGIRESLKGGLIGIEPFSEARKIIQRSLGLSHPIMSDEYCEEREWAIAVNTNGDVYSTGNMYYPELSYGNIFAQSIEQILSSETRKKRIEKTQGRFKEVCRHCPFFQKGCDGSLVSHATLEDYREFKRLGGCYHHFISKMILPDIISEIDKSPHTPPKDQGSRGLSL